jgi:MFS family permease
MLLLLGNLHMLASPRSALLAVFCAFGAMIGGFAGSFPVIMQNSGIGPFEFGFGTMISMGADVLAMTAAGFLARRYCNRTMLLLLLPCVGLAGFSFMTSASATAFYLANIAYGLAMGGTDVFMNGEGSNIERDLRKPVFSSFHGVLSLSLSLFAIIGSFVSTLGSPWMTSLLQIACLAFAWECVRRNVPVRTANLSNGKSHTLGNKFPLAVIGVIAGICFAAELSAIIWSSQLLNEQTPRLAAIAGLGAAFFGLCTAIVRMNGDLLRKRFGDRPALITSIAIAMAGFALLSMSTTFVISVLAFAIVGLGAALQMPCSYALAASSASDNRVGALSFVGSIAGTPRIVAPMIFGWVASNHGIGSSFGLLSSALAIALVLALSLARLRCTNLAPETN